MSVIENQPSDTCTVVVVATSWPGNPGCWPGNPGRGPASDRCSATPTADGGQGSTQPLYN
eukprot:5445600-Pyramimonas_sp.AAC.1